MQPCMTPTNKDIAMNQNVVFTSDVLRALKGLPEQQRLAVTNALVSNYLLGRDICDSLVGLDATVYAMLNCSVSRASARYDRQQAR